MVQLKGSLLGEEGMEPSTDVIAQVANEVYAQDLMLLLITHLQVLEFEVSQPYGISARRYSSLHHHFTAIIPLAWLVCKQSFN